MIKNTIIVILLILLLITLYAYSCLSSSMVDFKKERLEYILKKEKELNDKEEKLVSTEICNQNMEKYKSLLIRISNDLTKTSEEMNLLSKYVNQTNNAINNDIDKSNYKNKIPKKFEKPVDYIVPEENFENFENLGNDLLDFPIEDGFISALDN